MLSDDVMAQVVRLRKILGLSAVELADRCEGITANMMMNLESGRRTPDGQRRRRRVTVDDLVALAEGLGVEPCDLLRNVYTEENLLGARTKLVIGLKEEN